MEDYTTREDCRLCSSCELDEVLRLTPTPPANEFVAKASESQGEIPLYLAACRKCGHVQLPVVVDPERLFKNYVYVSGTSPVFVDHFRRYANEMISRYELVPGDLVVEIGSNDGTLLRFFKEAGMRVLGVDPAESIAKKATEEGVETWPAFFTVETAERIARERGRAALVVANNVFAHADDLQGIAAGVKALMDSHGAFVFEVSYLVDVLKKTLFDTIYHEHLSYHSVGPLVKFFQRTGMSVRDVQRVDTHGGSIRCTVVNHPGDTLVTKRVLDLMAYEASMGLDGSSHVAFDVMNVRIAAMRERLREFLTQAKADGKRVAGFGAPAKATTLMYHFGLGSDDLQYIVDDSPLKQGLLTPGKHVPVVPSSRMKEDAPDYAVVLAWNFADSIVARNAWFTQGGGKFVVPIPEFSVR